MKTFLSAFRDSLVLELRMSTTHMRINDWNPYMSLIRVYIEVGSEIISSERARK